MPTLPTLTITDPVVWNRLMAAFKGNEAEFKKWLKTALVQELESREAQVVQEEVRKILEAKAQELKGFLDSAT